MIELLHCDLLFCLILGEEGHMSKDCETGPKTHTVQNEDGITGEIYVLTEDIPGSSVMLQKIVFAVTLIVV